MANTTKRNTLPWIVGAGALAVAALAYAYFLPGTEKITPWVAYEQSAPFLDAPHLLMIGSYKAKVRIKRGLLWHTVYDERGHSSGAAWNRPVALDGGRAILLDVYPKLMIYREGVEFPAYLDREACRLRYASPDRSGVVCMTFGHTQVGKSFRITSVRLDVYDSTGKQVGLVPGVVPPELDAHFNQRYFSEPVLLGYSDGFPVLGTPMHSDSVARYLCAAVIIGRTGLREIERKVMTESGICPRDAKEWSVIRNGGVAAQL